ncbi:MAG: hypothetical protein ABR573_03510 [Candidatus Dormibacteria bacterium]
MKMISTRRFAIKAIPLLGFVVLPLATISAMATTVTGTALPGALTATYPAAIALGSGTVGAPVNLTLNVSGGAILVSDLRGSTGGTWSTTAALSNFTATVGTATIPSSSVSMSPGAVIASATNPTGTTATAGSASQDFATTSTNVTFMSASGAGQGTFGLNPTFTWTVPANSVAAAGTGTAYTATMTFTTQ